MRWDTLAWLAYGDASRMTDLLEANQDIGVYNWLPVGVIVKCPIIIDAAISQQAAALPAWKQT